MAAGATTRQRMVISAGVHPHWRAVAKTFARGTGHEIIEVPLKDGVTDWASVDTSGAAAVVAAYPNYLGVLEDMSAAKALSVESGGLFVVCGDPLAAGVLKTAGDWGADVFVGEGQPLGTALSFGGPYLGLFACTHEQIRRLPGRIVGRDARLEPATSLRHYAARTRAGHPSREGHFERLYQPDVDGGDGRHPIGLARHAGLRRSRDAQCAWVRTTCYDDLVRIPGVAPVSTQPFFREFALRLPRAASGVLDDLVGEGILGGLSVESLAGVRDPSIEGDTSDVVLVAVTEKRTRAELDRYADDPEQRCCHESARRPRGVGAPCSDTRPSPPSSNSRSPDAARTNCARPTCPRRALSDLIPAEHLKSTSVALAEVSERDLVGHFTRLSPPSVLGRSRGVPSGLVHHEVQPQIL